MLPTMLSNSTCDYLSLYTIYLSGGGYFLDDIFHVDRLVDVVRVDVHVVSGYESVPLVVMPVFL